MTESRIDAYGRVRLLPKRERCALCGKALLRPGLFEKDMCRSCEQAMPLEDFRMHH